MKKIRINWWDDAALWTRQIMEAHYTRKLDAVMEWLAEDVMGIGPVHAKYVYGKKNVEKLLRKERAAPCEISGADYDIIYGDANTCITVGRHTLLASEETALVVSAAQRGSRLCFPALNGSHG